ncbi:MAG: type 4a pilus biogenesis protein PilO [Deltaproteobacteria bacterium]|nr:type 4a pilus biogenesis protein PilO [Deltaproteobacteria bacterium]
MDSLDKLMSQINLDAFGKLPSHARLAAGPLVFLILCGAYWGTLYKGQQDKMTAQLGRKQAMQRELSEVKSIAGNLPAFQAEVDILEKQLNKALKQLPVGSELPTLLSDISTLGLESGLDIGLFEPRPEVTHSFYAEVPIDLEFEGGYHSTAIFFGKLASLPRIVNVNGIEMHIKKEDEEKTVLEVRGTITTFRFLEGGGA